MPTFADTPVGRDSRVRSLGGEDEDDPQGGAALDDGLGQAGGLVLVVGVGEQFLALVDERRDQEQSERLAGGEFGGDLVLRAQLPRQPPDRRRALVQFAVEVAERVHAGVEGRRVGAGAVVVAAVLDHREVAGALELEHPQLHAGVERGGEQHDAHGERLAHPGLGPDQHRLEHQDQGHQPAALVDPERDRPEQVRAAALRQRPGLRLGRGHVLVPDPQHQPAGVRLGRRLGPHAPEGAAQPGGEPVAALHDVGRR